MNRLRISITVLSIYVSFLIVSTTGCTRYLEEETPAAQELIPSRAVAPVVPGSRAHGVEDTIAGSNQAAPSISTISPYIGRPLSGAVLPMTQEAYAASITRFEQAYAKAKSPRIAVYLNRTLSDEVREWITPVRHVVTGRGEKVSIGDSGPTVITPEGTIIESGRGAKTEGSADKERGLMAYTQGHLEQVTRRNPEEVWIWRFEDNFLQPFLKGRARIVDRATILRLVAQNSGKQGDPYSLNSVKKIEMDALVDYADIYVEILVTRDHTSPSGYAFRATAKETKTGIIVGNVAKTGRDYRYEKSYEVFATSSGYKLKKGSQALVLENVSQELAIDLMNSMASVWKQ